MIARQGLTVVVGTIALFAEVHEWNRANQPGYFEVYLRVPLDELRRRDPKGLYRRFDAGDLNNVAGLDLPVDEPVAPDLLLDYVPGLGPDTTLSIVLGKLAQFRLDADASRVDEVLGSQHET
jgi:adenylylsulfate kinase